MIDFFA